MRGRAPTSTPAVRKNATWSEAACPSSYTRAWPIAPARCWAMVTVRGTASTSSRRAFISTRWMRREKEPCSFDAAPEAGGRPTGQSHAGRVPRSHPHGRSSQSRQQRRPGLVCEYRSVCESLGGHTGLDSLSWVGRGRLRCQRRGELQRRGMASQRRQPNRKPDASEKSATRSRGSMTRGLVSQSRRQAPSSSRLSALTGSRPLAGTTFRSLYTYLVFKKYGFVDLLEREGL